ncbi:MAG TPA: hypothetical protein VE088_04665 [Gaiellaceae bacterium]|jgi:Tfp pilus assembly protein PilV|nr:hypothetical protein [Gaiellaceae bacterium]
MRARPRTEDGFLLVELLAATLIISIALLALMGAYEAGFTSLHAAAKNSSAGLIADNQLELYASLQYSSIGLDATTLASVQSSDSTYASDEAALPGSGSDVTISGCGSSAQCLPVQTVKGGDGKTYKLETFIRALANPSATSWTEKVVTVVVRDTSESGSPKVVTLQTAFDQGPA